MSARRPGAATREFMSKGFRSHAPRNGLARAGLIAMVLLGAGFAQIDKTNRAAAAPAPIAAPAPTTAPARWTVERLMFDTRIAAGASLSTAAEALSNQTALRTLVQFEAAKASDQSYSRDGKDIRYIVPDLDKALLAHIALVQTIREPMADKATDAVYGIDDGMWAWMMRNHADKVGLGAVMDGIKVNDNGSIDADNAFKLGAMLALKNDPAVATKVYAQWLASEIMTFDGQTGKPPTPGEIAAIALTDSEHAADLAFMATDHPDAKAAHELGMRGSDWRRPLFVNDKGWMGAKDTMAGLERRTAERYKDAYGPIPTSAAEPMLDEDFSVSDMRKDPDRFARIVLQAAKEIQPDELHFAMVGTHLSDDAFRERLAEDVAAIAKTIDDFRKTDTGGGIFAFGEGQWLQAAKAHSDLAFTDSFMQGIKVADDGRVHAASAEQFGTFMRLREHAPIATQVVLARTVAMMGTLHSSLGRTPTRSEMMISHLFGVAAGEEFAKAADRNTGIDPLRFSPDDARGSWAASFLVGNGGLTDAAALRKTADAFAEVHGAEMRELVERHADVSHAMRP